MNESFDDQLRRAIQGDEVEIRSDAQQVIRTGRRTVRARRLGWGLAASAVVVAAALVVPGLLHRTLPAEPADTVLATPSPSPGTLIGTSWEVLKLDGADLIPGTSITLAFGEGTVTGFGGCNGFGSVRVDGKLTNGWYRTYGDRLSIGPVAATWKGCGDGIGEQESRYFEALTGVQRF
ncbi:MAG: META domain-containing protein, partial [Propionibacteriaceae bacterium]|nr:META domain-containing protein [Propionibacteriaceae bacterium]